MDRPTTGSAPLRSTIKTARQGTERVSRPSPIGADRTLALPARAKLNLDLHIVGRLPDGFHELVSTMQSIALHDLLVISPAEKTELTTDGIAVVTKNNSVLKAQRALESAAQKRLPAHLHLHKRIPPGSGLGGASSDAAAALRALCTLYELKDIDLAKIAAEVGADVPFFLRGGRAKAEARGERLTQLRTTDEWFALAWPRIELLTADVYRAWDEVKGDGLNELKRAAEHVDPRVKDFADGLGAGWQMTGSGSAFFKRCGSEEEAKAAVAAPDAWTAVTFAVGAWA